MAEGKNRSGAYASSKNDTMDAMESLSKKLTADLRAQIQTLKMYPVLSPKWYDMSKNLSRMKDITVMESKLPKENKDSTLWECEEQALRFLLEDGKLNLCLRLLVDVKKFQYEVLEHDTSLPDKDEKEINSFEQAVGMIMRKAWQHEEAIQTTDIPLLIEHISTTLQYATRHQELMTSNTDTLPTRQETLVIYYFNDVLELMNAGKASEEGILREVKRRNTTMLMVNHLLEFDQLRKEDRQAGCRALSLIFGSEDYGIEKHQAAYVPQAGEKDVVELRDTYKDLVTESEGKKLLRQLINRVERFEFEIEKRQKKAGK